MTPDEQVSAWNAANPVGTQVLLTRDDGNTICTWTRSRARLLEGCNKPVIWVDGVSACYLLERCTPVPVESGSIEKRIARLEDSVLRLKEPGDHNLDREPNLQEALDLAHAYEDMAAGLREALQEKCEALARQHAAHQMLLHELRDLRDRYCKAAQSHDKEKASAKDSGNDMLMYYHSGADRVAAGVYEALRNLINSYGSQ